MSQDELNQYKTLFLTTGQDVLKTLKDNFAVYSNNTSDFKAVNNMHIAAHSLKSQSAFMNYKVLAHACLVLERVFYKIKEQKLQINQQQLAYIHDAILQTDRSFENIRKEGGELGPGLETQQLITSFSLPKTNEIITY